MYTYTISQVQYDDTFREICSLIKALGRKLDNEDLEIEYIIYISNP